MAYVVPRPKGRWELRRSRATAAGPRSETLLSFGELDADGIEHAVRRSGGSLSAEQIRGLARRAGAPLALDPARRCASELLRELGAGASLPASWRAALREALAGGEDRDGAASMIGEWAGADPARRGAALRELLLLADAIPAPPSRGDASSFPGFSTGGPRS